jgi:2-polyprenyl-3-methyl-5-hydroxy-6-metoxy-1,4-benzoquinol methylase
MRIGIIPENLVERLALRLGLVPASAIEAWFSFMLARAIMAGTKLGIFEALASGPLTCDEIAGRCGTDHRATSKLLNALVGAGCVRAGGGRYRLTSAVRRGLLENSPNSWRDQTLFHYLEWHWWDHCEEYVRTGQPLLLHNQMTDEEWVIYQRGMRSGIEMPAHWVARHLPVPRTATTMLDIGGGHGYFSVALCRRYPRLRSTVLDLPQGIRHAAPLLAREGMGDRVVHRAGDALTDDLGSDAYDVVFLAALVHHFDEETNRDLMRRIAQALHPGGIVAVWEPLRQDPAARIRQFGGLLDLYFGFFSRAGTWSSGEIADWQRGAGLEPRRPIRMWMVPDLALHVAQKPPSFRFRRGPSFTAVVRACAG